MITRREAEEQATQCLGYHAALSAGVLGVSVMMNRRAAPWIAAMTGGGLLFHAACLYAIPATREALLRKTASMMEDRRRAHAAPNRPQAARGSVAVAAS